MHLDRLRYPATLPVVGDDADTASWRVVPWIAVAGLLLLSSFWFSQVAPQGQYHALTRRTGRSYLISHDPTSNFLSISLAGAEAVQ